MWKEFRGIPTKGTKSAMNQGSLQLIPLVNGKEFRVGESTKRKRGIPTKGNGCQRKETKSAMAEKGVIATHSENQMMRIHRAVDFVGPILCFNQGCMGIVVQSAGNFMVLKSLEVKAICAVSVFGFVPLVLGHFTCAKPFFSMPPRNSAERLGWTISLVLSLCERKP